MKASEIITNLFARDRVLWYLVLAILNAVVAVSFGFYTGYVFCALVLFAAFDAYGYFYLTQGNTYGSEDQIRTATYRICQNMFFVLLIAVLLLIAPWHVAAMFVLLWWLGVCDYLYYEMLRQMDYLNSCEDMPWLWWSPYGIVLRLQGKPIPCGYLKFFTWCGFILLVIYGFIV